MSLKVKTTNGSWVYIPGTKGRDGDEHVYIGAEAPSDKSMIWFQTTTARDSGVRRFDLNSNDWVLLPGTQGIGIASAIVNEDGNLILTLDDIAATTIDTGYIKGPPGAEVQLRSNGSYLQWKYDNEADWKDLIALEEIIKAYLPLSGGTLTGDLNLSYTTNSDSSKLSVFDANKASYYNIASYTGTLNLGDASKLTIIRSQNFLRRETGYAKYKIYDEGTFIADTDYATPAFVTTETAKYLPLTGGLMTGPVLIHNSGDSLDTILAYSDGVSILSTAFNSETSYRGIQLGGDSTSIIAFNDNGESRLQHTSGSQFGYILSSIYFKPGIDYVEPSSVINSILTDYTAETSAKDITSTDSIKTALQKVGFYTKAGLYTKAEIDNLISSVLTYAGSVNSFADLPTTGVKVGDVYNIATEFDLGGSHYPAGTNVAAEAINDNNITWDPLGGSFNLTKESVEAVLTGNITSHTHSYLPLTGGSLTGNLTSYGRITATGQFIVQDATYPQIIFRYTGDSAYDSLLFTNTLSGSVKSLLFRPDSTVSQDGIVYHSLNFQAGVDYVAPGTLSGYVTAAGTTQYISGYKIVQTSMMFGEKSDPVYNTSGSITGNGNSTLLMFRLAESDSIWRLQQESNTTALLGIQGRKAMKITSNASDISITADKFIGAATSLVEENIYTATNFGTSDKRLKRSIKKIDEAVIEKAIDSINLNRSFIYKKSGVKGYGPIAQDLEEVFPELVYTNDRGIKGVNNTALLHLQIQGLYQKIQELQDQLAQTSFKEKIGIWSRLKQALKKWLLP
jgi:hypothetical protein